MRKVYRMTVFMVCVVLAGAAGAGTLSQQDAAAQALSWMSGNPIMSRADGTAASVSSFPEGGSYVVYVVELSPTGYLILNSDNRLPLVLSFSADSVVNLSDDPQNALRAMLLDYCERMEEKLSMMPAFPVAMAALAGGDELYGPFLETSWNQNDPYNLFCPETDNPFGASYDGRVPSGCVPTAFAQILNFHRWPVYGTGSHSYTDSSGSITGSHNADFSDSYDWANMKTAHSPSDSQAEQEAVGELMFELGVAADADYESSGTSSSTSTLGNRLDDYFYYESIAYSPSQASLISLLEADLRAGFPCVVSIPNHAIVADGLMVDGGVTTYHINYGWGGSNNGWFSASGIPGGSLQSGVTSIRPALMAFPESEAVLSGNGSAELNWILPKRLENEVSKLTVKQYVSGVWQTFYEDTTLASRRFSEVTTVLDDCDDFSVFEVTSPRSSYSGDWTVTNVADVGNCFYKATFDHSVGYHITTRSPINPTSVTRLKVRTKYNLAPNEMFRVLLATDGSNFSEIWSATNVRSDWSDITLDLSPYSGMPVDIRFQYEYGGSYYGDGGVWIDSISTQEVTNPELEGQPVYYTEVSGLADGTYTLAAVLTDTNAVEHAVGPSFTLTVSGADDDNDGLPNWWEEQYYGGATNAVTNVLAANGVNTVLEAYIAGINPTNPSSFFNTSLTNQSGFVVSWNAVSGRVYSVYGTTNLTAGFQPLATNMVWPQSSWTDTVQRSESFYQVDVGLE